MSNDPAASPPSKDSKPLRTFFPREATAQQIAEALNKMIAEAKQQKK